MGRRVPRPIAQLLRSTQGGLPALIQSLIKRADGGDAETREAACAQLRSLAAQDHREHCVALYNYGAVRVLVKNLDSGTAVAQAAAASALHSIAFDKLEHQKALVAAGGIGPLVRLLKTGSAKVQEEVRTATPRNQ